MNAAAYKNFEIPLTQNPLSFLFTNILIIDYGSLNS